jgi:hypothetical protein
MVPNFPLGMRFNTFPSVMIKLPMFFTEGNVAGRRIRRKQTGLSTNNEGKDGIAER